MEKEKFFAQLDGLDESTEDEDDANQSEPHKRLRVEGVNKSVNILTRTEHFKVNREFDGEEPARPGVPFLGRATTLDQPTSYASDYVKRNLPPIKRTNSEPGTSSRFRKSNPVKPVGTLFEGLTFCKSALGC